MRSGRFDPHRIAILEEKPAAPIVAGAGNTVQLTSFDIHEIRLSAKVMQTALMVLSEIYYPAGWKAYVDGRETKIYKTNYILRSVQLPPGEHEIVFKFAPASYRLGAWISVTTLLLLLGLLAVQLFLRREKLWRRARTA